MEENTIPSHKMKASRHISEETVASGQWLSLNRVTYKDPNDTERIWEVVHRTSRVPGSSSDVACTDPGICDTMQNMVTVEIDGDDPVNVNPSNSPDETEFIEVLTVPLDRLLESLNKYSEEGFIVHGLLYTYAIAMAQTRA